MLLKNILVWMRSFGRVGGMQTKSPVAYITALWFFLIWIVAIKSTMNSKFFSVIQGNRSVSFICIQNVSNLWLNNCNECNAILRVWLLNPYVVTIFWPHCSHITAHCSCVGAHHTLLMSTSLMHIMNLC